MPLLEKCSINISGIREWLPFNVARSYKESRKLTGVHFFIYDEGFSACWSNKDILEKISDFTVVATPDFSTYTDMPLAHQVWQRFRSQYIGAWMQQVLGYQVIPTLCWSTEDSFEFTFDGIPKGSVCITNSMGINIHDHRVCHLHRSGLKEAIRRIEPKKILVYGGAKDFYPQYDYVDIKPFWKGMVARVEEKSATEPPKEPVFVPPPVLEFE